MVLLVMTVVLYEYGSTGGVMVVLLVMDYLDYRIGNDFGADDVADGSVLVVMRLNHDKVVDGSEAANF